MTIAQLVAAVKKHALANYEAGGWDVIIECWTDDEIACHLEEAGAFTFEDALAAFADLIDVWSDRQADERNSREDWGDWDEPYKIGDIETGG